MLFTLQCRVCIYNKMKICSSFAQRLTCCFAAAMLFFTCPSMATEGWETNVTVAEQKAQEQGKGLLIFFTGSDWCAPCMRLHQHVLSKKEFIDVASQFFVLVELDYPNKREHLTNEQNEHLIVQKKRYDISSYPTVIFTDANGRPVCGNSGFPQFYSKKQKDGTSLNLSPSDKVDDAIKYLDIVNSKIKAFNELYARVRSSQGDERYASLGEFLKLLTPHDIETFYYSLFYEAMKAPGDPTGYAAKWFEEQEMKNFREFERSLRQGFRSDSAAFFDAFERYLQNNSNLRPAVRQKILFEQCELLKGLERYVECLAKVHAAIEAMPESYLARGKLQEAKAWIESNSARLEQSKIEKKSFGDLRRSMQPSELRNPARYRDALERFLSDKGDWTPEARKIVVEEIACAYMAEGKIDEATARLQQEIDRASDIPEAAGSNRALASIIESFRTSNERHITTMKSRFDMK